MMINANWKKWLFEAPLTAAWRSRLDLSLGVVLSGAAVIGLAAMIRPDPSKLPAARAMVAWTAAHSTPTTDTQVSSSPPSPMMTTEFSSATRAGDVHAMTRAYTRGMPLEGTLSVAARSGNKAAVSWLLNHGADVHDEEEVLFGPILMADAYPEIVSLLRERGAREPSLSVAAMANAPNAVSRILSTHPNVNARGSYPLQAATMSTTRTGTAANRLQIATMLIEAGADVNRDSGSQSALAGAVARCDDDDTNVTECMRLVQLLLDHGARMSGDALGAALSLDDATRAVPLETLLALPLEEGVTAVALSEATHVNPQDLKRVVAKGVDWAWQDGEDNAARPVLSAVRRGDRDSVRDLLDAGAPVDVHFKDGSSAFGEALDNAANSADHARIVELLVGRGADVNRRLPDGRTPLFAAAESGDLRVVNFLLSKGARVNDLVLDDMALDIADQNGHQPVARVLHAHGARRARPQYPQYR